MLARAATGNVALIYLESPANPTNALVDIQAVAASRDAIFANAPALPPIAIDNTFLGPLWLQPLKHGADIVVYSLTNMPAGIAISSPAACSGGGAEAFASHPAGTTRLSVKKARKAALGITDNIVRISIGVKDADDLIADFTQALDAIRRR